MNLAELTEQIRALRSRMADAELTEQIRALRSRMADVDEARRVAPAGDPGDGGVLFELLTNAAEELDVAGEELRRQNEALRAAHWALEEERGRYRDLFENAPDAYLVTDANGIIREANQQAGALLNVPRKFLAGKPLVLFLAAGARPAFWSELARLRTSAGAGHYDFRMLPRRGPAFDAAVSVVAVPDEGGRSIALRWTVRDVTERRRIEDHLRRLNQDLERLVRRRTEQVGAESRQRERLLIQAHAVAEPVLDLIQDLDAIIWAADVTGDRFTFISRRAETILGYPATDWLDVPRFWAEHLHPADRDWMIERRQQQLRDDGSHSESEYRLMSADGRAVWFREALHVVRDEEGRPRELRGLLVNISRRKRVERKLYAHRHELSARLEDISYLHAIGERLGATLELPPVLEEILAGAMSIQGALKGMIRLHDRERGELVLASSAGLPEPSLGFNARVPLDTGACGLAIRTGRPVAIADVEAGDEDEVISGFDREAARLGGYRAAFAVPLRDRDGASLGTIETYFDEPHRPNDRQVRLVEQFAAQAAVSVANALRYHESRAAARSREVFLAVLAHELRNPLQAIRMSLLNFWAADSGAESGPGPGSERAEIAAVVERQVGRLERLIGDLLDASRIAEGKPTLRREPTDLRQALACAVESTRAEIEGRGHALRASIPEVPLWAEADPARIEQVVVNLLTNAAKYTPPGGRIELEAAHEGEELVVRVRDNGNGIAPEGLARIFDRFAQDDPATATAREGLGVGLVTLPALPGPPESVSTASAPAWPRPEAVATTPLPAPPSGNNGGAAAPPRRRVLVVDDQADAAEQLARWLRAEGNEVAVAFDGPSALAVAREWPPNVVLLDVEMPGMDGFEVARRLRPMGQHARFVALTGHDLSDSAEARRTFDAQLVKPVDDRQLRSELERARPDGAREPGPG
jgi:PAS domain S-box-containing protein